MNGKSTIPTLWWGILWSHTHTAWLQPALSCGHTHCGVRAWLAGRGLQRAVGGASQIRGSCGRRLRGHACRFCRCSVLAQVRSTFWPSPALPTPALPRSPVPPSARPGRPVPVQPPGRPRRLSAEAHTPAAALPPPLVLPPEGPSLGRELLHPRPVWACAWQPVPPSQPRAPRRGVRREQLCARESQAGRPLCAPQMGLFWVTAPKEYRILTESEGEAAGLQGQALAGCDS